MNTQALERTATTKDHVRAESSRKPQIPFLLRAIQWLFPKTEFVAPIIAQRWFIKLFFSPPRFPIPHLERAVISQSNKFDVMLGDTEVKCYRWGEGPVVLLVHGWAGRASQFRNFIPFLTNAGYQVVAFDAPAHGLTGGSRTTVIDFKDAILKIEKEVGCFHAIIAHSLGGGASLFAMSEGLTTPTLITIATPTDGDEIINEFNARLNGSGKSIAPLRAYIQKTLDRPFDQFMSTHFIPEIRHSFDWLIIHDNHDREASPENARRLNDAHPTARLWRTDGLGHVRILKDEKVIEGCLAFIASGKGV
jgi:pimeloyl-ACP methyl ester carboxylesterase